MTIIVNDTEYKVRHNYLHRWKAELVLEHREDGQQTIVQFELNDLPEFHRDKITGLWKEKKYRGYWCEKNGFREIKFSFKEIS